MSRFVTCSLTRNPINRELKWQFLFCNHCETGLQCHLNTQTYVFSIFGWYTPALAPQLSQKVSVALDSSQCKSMASCRSPRGICISATHQWSHSSHSKLSLCQSGVTYCFSCYSESLVQLNYCLNWTQAASCSLQILRLILTTQNGRSLAKERVAWPSPILVCTWTQ